MKQQTKKSKKTPEGKNTKNYTTLKVGRQKS